MEQKKHRPIVYDYYNYLKDCHYGKENGVNREILSDIFHVSLKMQKDILREINESDTLPKLVSTSGSIYMCRTKEECENAAFNEFKSGLTRLKKGKKMLKKIDMNGQMKMQLGKYYKEAIECFEEDNHDD